MTAGSSGDDQKPTLDMQMSNPAGATCLSTWKKCVSLTNKIVGRVGHDSDIAACILFLAGPGGVFLNGQVLYPDGGMQLSIGGSIVD